MWKAGVVLITGANRGLGLEFVKQLNNFDKCQTIVACCRDPTAAQELSSLAEKSSKILIKRLDISNEVDIQKLSDDLNKDLPQGLNLLINNAGCYSKLGSSISASDIPRSIEGETSATLINTYRVNVVGPFLLTRALTPLLTKGAQILNEQSIVFNVSSTMGSIQENGSGGSYNYRLSKTALNMLTKNFSIDLAQLGIMCVACHPGWVVTNMGGPNALIDTNTSVSGMLERIIELTPQDNGKLIRFDGKPIKY